MHEFAICQGLIRQVEAIARQNNAQFVTSIALRIGPLAGVDATLLQHAFTVASAEGMTKGTKLQIECSPILIYCRACDKESTASPNNLICAGCGNWHTELLQGNELLLLNVELELEDNHV